MVAQTTNVGTDDERREQALNVSENTEFTVSLLFIAVAIGVASWLGAELGDWAFFVFVIAMIPVFAWVFVAYFPERPPASDEENHANQQAWAGFFDKLFYRVAPLVLIGWALFAFIDRL